MFNKIFGITLSPEEQYRKLLKEKRIEAFNAGKCRIGYCTYKYNKERWKYDTIKWREKYYTPNHSETHWIFEDRDDIGIQWEEDTLNDDTDKEEIYYENFITILNKREEEMKNERERQNQIEKQKIIDEDYLKKLNELLKIKPLDEDLKANIDKASEIIEIGKRIIEDTKRIHKLRKDFYKLSSKKI